MPSEMADKVDETAKQEGCTRSELLRKALLDYIEEHKWRQLVEYRERRARAMGIEPKDVESLVEEYRAEVASAKGRETLAGSLGSQPSGASAS